MSCQCKTFVRQAGDDRFYLVDVEDPLTLNQNYNAFALLADVRNYHSIVPILEMKDLTLVDDLINENDLGSWHIYNWFYVAEVLTLDIDRPLEFKPNKKPLGAILAHRAADVQPGDTYRSFMERETTLLLWFNYLIANQIEAVVLAFD